MTDFGKESLPSDWVLRTDDFSGEVYRIPAWAAFLVDDVHELAEDVSAISDLFSSKEDYLEALSLACEDARKGINLPLMLSEPTPPDHPHYRMQETLHRMYLNLRAREEQTARK